MQDKIALSSEVHEWIVKEESDWLQGLIDEHLTEREALVIRGYYWEGAGLVELGRRLGRTKERARQLKMKAVAKLKSAIARCGEDLTESDRIDLLSTFKEGPTK